MAYRIKWIQMAMLHYARWGIAAMVAYGPQQASATSGGCHMLPLQVAGRKPHPSPSW